ncbi:MAG: hypothetical protein JWO03_3 [Bacteroidetes bacterium]|nr:hypothetical protein [Bacteroidota bacterium]
MSYLLDFIRSFDENEWKQFRQLDVIGTEEAVRDEYVKRALSKNFDEAALPEKLELTQNHFYKINSVLLDKIISRLYGTDYDKALKAILLKGLGALLWHELKIMQRKIQKEKNPDRLTQFYKGAFDTLIKMFHPNYNAQLTREYGKKYLQSLGNKKTIEHEAYIALFTHYGDMLAHYFSGDLSYQKQAWAVLSSWQKKLALAQNPSADAYYHFVLGNCYKYYGDNTDLFIKAQEDGLEALKKATPQANILLRGRLLCETGFGYMEKNEFDKAQPFYEKAFGLSDEQFAKPYFHAGNYFYSCLCNQQPPKAQQIFEKYLQNYLQDNTNRSLRFDVIQMKFVLALHTRQYDIAYDCLNEMRSYKKGEVTRNGNILIRFSETLYYYKLGEDKVAAAMAKKNLKFLHLSENNSNQYDYHRQFIDSIDKLIKKKEGSLRFPERLEQQIASLQGGIYHMYNCLL